MMTSETDVPSAGRFGMRARTASLAIEYQQHDRGPALATGSCTIVEREEDFYYRWCIITDQPAGISKTFPEARLQLAAQGGTASFEVLGSADDRFERGLEHIISSITHHQPRQGGSFHVLHWAWTPVASDPTVLETLVRVLEAARKHPGMYFGEPNVEVLQGFLHGVRVGAGLVDYRITHTPDSPFHTLVEARGWPYSARSPAFAMRERGLSEQEIVDELLQIEILAWKATYNLDS
jgi:hypothetical protein